jgi:ribosome-interacting GTPase 1
MRMVGVDQVLRMDNDKCQVSVQGCQGKRQISEKVETCLQGLKVYWCQIHGKIRMGPVIINQEKTVDYVLILVSEEP